MEAKASVFELLIPLAALQQLPLNQANVTAFLQYSN